MHLLDVDDMYQLSEDSLIWAYKFVILSVFEQEIIATSISEPPRAFFLEKYFVNGNKNDEKKEWRIFEKLSNRMNEFQLEMSRIDSIPVESVNELRLCCAKELFSWSGYNRISNIIYAIYYLIAEKNNDKTHDNVVETLKIMELLWITCSMVRSVTGRVLTSVYRLIGKVLKYIGDETYNYFGLQKFLKEEIPQLDYYWKIYYQGENKFINNVLDGNIYDNDLCGLYMCISYIDDYCTETGIDVMTVKKRLFYPDKWNLEVEHIASKSFFGDDNIWCHKIGNLMFLEHNINESLGGNLKKNREKFQSFQDEYAYKIDPSSPTKSYKDSELKCVKVFLTTASKQSAEEVINKRSNQKKEMLLELFSMVMPDEAMPSPKDI